MSRYRVVVTSMENGSFGLVGERLSKLYDEMGYATLSWVPVEDAHYIAENEADLVMAIRSFVTQGAF